MRYRGSAGTIGLTLLAVLCEAAVWAATTPAPVSPGDVSVATLVEARCPTFSWAGVPTAGGYQIAVFRISAEHALEPELVARVELPADSRSFTPPVGQCLERGQRYAWSVAAAEDGGELVWSAAFLFEIEATAAAGDVDEDVADEVVSVEQAVAVLERYLTQHGAGVEHDLARPENASAALRGGGAAASEESRRDAAARSARGRVEEERGEQLAGVVRVVAAAAPALGSASLKVSSQVHLASASAVFKNGDVFLWDDTAGNTALGREALESVSTGTRNTAVGRQALRNTTGGTAFGGSFNTAVGDGALPANTTGKRNTATGSDALPANTVGSGNTATGASALLNNVLGDYNVATGAFALRNNTEGSSNTAVGYYALRANTDGSSNTAVGASALRATGGHFNTAVGKEALRSTEKSRQTAIGGRALMSSTTGEWNTALGYGALQSSVDGYRNTALGPFALTHNTGSGNIAVGYKAGLANMTGSDNIFLGSPGASGDDETIRIGAGQERTFIAGIHGETTAGSAISVMIDSNGQLGTVSSSRRTKQDVQDPDSFLDRLLELRPVAFRYRNQVARDPEAPLEFGLIAEEVAEVFPELVVFDREGRPETVRYHLLSSLLLEELKEQHGELEELRARVEAVESGSHRAVRKRRPQPPRDSR